MNLTKLERQQMISAGPHINNSNLFGGYELEHETI
jgi:hypothetical protein